ALRAPVTPAGLAVADYYETNEGATLTIGAAGLLANDTGTGLHVTAADAVSTWGVAVTVNADGSFTYTTGTRFQGLSPAETPPAHFTYTATDGAGHSPSAGVDILIRGSNTTPTATNITPDPSQPSLYVRASSTTQVAVATVLSYARDFDVNDRLS